MRYERVCVDHRIMGGVPCIAGTRIPVATLVSMMAEGMTIDEIETDFPQISRDDVRQALQFAAENNARTGDAAESVDGLVVCT